MRHAELSSTSETGHARTSAWAVFTHGAASVRSMSDVRVECPRDRWRLRHCDGRGREDVPVWDKCQHFSGKHSLGQPGAWEDVRTLACASQRRYGVFATAWAGTWRGRRVSRPAHEATDRSLRLARGGARSASGSELRASPAPARQHHADVVCDGAGRTNVRHGRTQDLASLIWLWIVTSSRPTRITRAAC